MNYLHSEVQVGQGQAIVVQLDHAANVRVMDDANFHRYQQGQEHRFFGGLAQRSPAVIRPPSGRWHVAIDLGGYTGSVRASVAVH
jgi:hypothetical protein